MRAVSVTFLITLGLFTSSQANASYDRWFECKNASAKFDVGLYEKSSWFTRNGVEREIRANLYTQNGTKQIKKIGSCSHVVDDRIVFCRTFCKQEGCVDSYVETRDYWRDTNNGRYMDYIVLEFFDASSMTEPVQYKFSPTECRLR